MESAGTRLRTSDFSGSRLPFPWLGLYINIYVYIFIHTYKYIFKQRCTPSKPGSSGWMKWLGVEPFGVAERVLLCMLLLSRAAAGVKGCPCVEGNAAFLWLWLAASTVFSRRAVVRHVKQQEAVCGNGWALFCLCSCPLVWSWGRNPSASPGGARWSWWAPGIPSIHCESTPGWLEPSLLRSSTGRQRLVGCSCTQGRVGGIVAWWDSAARSSVRGWSSELILSLLTAVSELRAAGVGEWVRTVAKRNKFVW